MDRWTIKEDFFLSEMAKSIRYIPLETREECYIPNAWQCKLQATEQHFFVVPKDQPILVFDNKGKFQGKIGSIGEGPGEVVRINSFVINEKEGWLAIFNPANSSALIYSLQGELIREFPVDKSIVRLIPDSKNRMVALSVDIQDEIVGDSRLIYLSPEGKELQRIELYKTTHLKERLSMTDAMQVLWEDNGSITVFEAPFNNIYMRNTEGSWESLPGFNPGEAGHINSVRVYGNYCLIYATNPEMHFFIASRETGKVTHCSTLIESSHGPDFTGMLNDLDGGLLFWPKASVSGRTLVSLYDAPVLIDYAQGKMSFYEGQIPEIHQSFKDMAAKLSIEDNPVVAVVTMK